MALVIGILGLPNVGKSTLFNAITNNNIDAQNFPFCTIEPNKGIVSVPDDRLSACAQLSQSKKMIPATIEFVDIAGLVKGASKGEGLGNQFLGNVRDCAALIHVVRCFDDDTVVHVDGSIDPERDIQVIHTELLMADFDQCQKALDNQKRKLKQNDKTELARYHTLEACLKAVSSETPIRSIGLSDSEQALIKGYHFLTNKPILYVCNVSEDAMASANHYVKTVTAIAESEGAGLIQLSASFEYEVTVLDEADQSDFLAEFGLKTPGLSRLAKACYGLLGLDTYITTGDEETRAWTIPKGAIAPKAAGVIHSDFELGFIRANVIHYDDLMAVGGLKQAKEKGLIRQEGKDYIVKDGDVIEFLFSG